MVTTEQTLLPALQALMSEAKRLGVDQAEASARLETGFSVSARNGDQESVQYHEQVLCRVTVYHNSKTGSACTTDVSKRGLQTALEKAVSLVQFTEPDPALGLPDLSDIAFEYPDCDLHHAWSLTPEEALRIALDLEAQALGFDKRCLAADGASVYSYQTTRFLVNSLGFCGTYQRSSHGKSINILAKEGDNMQSEYAYTLSCIPTALEDNSLLANEVAQKALARLGARSIPSQEVPVVFTADKASGFWGHIVSAMSGRRLYRQKSFLCNRVGDQIAQAGFTLKQEPHAKHTQGAMPFDADGAVATDIPLIEDGVFSAPLTSAYSARKLGVANTGNAGGLHHCVVPGDESLSKEVLCRRMGEGLLVTDLMGSQAVDILTGDYSRGANGYWVSGGEIQYPVEGITIASTLPKMLLGIQAIGSDRDERFSIKSGSILFDCMTVGGT